MREKFPHRPIYILKGRGYFYIVIEILGVLIQCVRKIKVHFVISAEIGKMEFYAHVTVPFKGLYLYFTPFYSFRQ